MDTGVVDTLNRHVAQLVCAHLDTNDEGLHLLTPWYRSPIADTLMGDNDTTDGDRAWLIGMFAARTPDVDIDRVPADFDWDNLFSHFRTEIETRRDPQTPHGGTAEIRCHVVV